MDRVGSEYFCTEWYLLEMSRFGSWSFIKILCDNPLVRRIYQCHVGVRNPGTGDKRVCQRPS